MSYLPLEFAKAHLVKAKAHFHHDDEIRYCCLELRFCIEHVVYDQLQVYIKEIGDESLKKWNPRDVIQEILLIDPYGDKTAILYMGRAPVGQSGDNDYILMGTDERLNMKWTMRSYNTLGSFLHSLTLFQMENGIYHSVEKIRNSIQPIISHLETVLSGPIFRMNFGAFININCECGQNIRRRVSSVKNGEIKCQNKDCGAIWEIADLDNENKQFSYKLKLGHSSCRCGKDIHIAVHRATPGRMFKCPECGLRLKLGLAVFYQTEESSGDANEPECEPQRELDQPNG